MTPARAMEAWTPAMPMRNIVVYQGEYRVSADPGVVLSTLLGSCVATCMFDPVARIGGMNHFLLACDPTGRARCERFGLHAMEVLINSLLKRGARKSRLEAKLFGGATLEGRMGRIGDENARFALDFLAAEGLVCRARSLGGNRGRRLRFVPGSGVASQCFIDHAPMPRPVLPPPDASDVLFFEE